MTKLEHIKKVQELLKRDYPEVITPLNHINVYQLFVAVLLSPQTTDEATNKVTKVLFQKYKSFEELSKANLEDLILVIRTVNYNKTKARHLIEASKIIIERFKNQVPTNLADITTLPGVGRKVGNVVISEWFAKPLYKRGSPRLNIDEVNILNEWEKALVLSEGFVVDTHVIRCSQRLGLTMFRDPKKIEIDLMKTFPQSEWNDASLRLIFHGRNRCKAQNPKCYLDDEWSKVCECIKLRSLN